MKTTMDKAGRIVIPHAIRDKAGLTPGMELEIRFQHGQVEIEPATAAVQVVKRGRWWTAESSSEGEPLTSEIVRHTIRQLREE